jgi:phosphoribosyl-AMP cyclohydrolase
MDKKQLEEGLELTIQFEKRGGLVPAIAQDYKSGEILMLGYVNPEALKETLKIGYATFWSTSRNELWTKGKSSGDLLKIKDVLTDCDQDSLIYKVERIGKGACHTTNQAREARRSCFYRRVKDGKGLEFLDGMK